MCHITTIKVTKNKRSVNMAYHSLLQLTLSCILIMLSLKLSVSLSMTHEEEFLIDNNVH